MAYLTLSQIVDDVIACISQAGGVGTQLYSEDRIALYIWQSFETVFEKQWWRQFLEWYTCTLDGVSGIVVEDISEIKMFDDIRCVMPDGYNRPLPVASLELNVLQLQSTAALYIDYCDIEDKAFKVYPATAVGTVYVQARKRPDRFIADDIIKFDALYLTYDATYRYLEDDGTNGGATEKFLKLATDRWNTINDMIIKPIQLDPNSRMIPTEWSVR